MNPMLRARHPASARPFSAPSDCSATRTSPEVGWSMPPIRLSSVVLPLPDGPIRATNSPVAISSESPSSTGISCRSRRYTLRTLLTWTDAMRSPPGTLRTRDAHAVAVLEPRGRVDHHALGALEAAADLDRAVVLGSRVHRARDHPAVLDDPHAHRPAAAHQRRRRHRDVAGARPRRRPAPPPEQHPGAPPRQG